jgi:ABC-2 type transport system permease protein
MSGGLGHARRAAKAFPTLLRVGLAEMVAYRAELVIWILTATLPLVMMHVWDRVAEGGPVEGMNQDDLARYFAASLITRQFTGAWVVWDLNNSIRTGALSPQLLKPINPMVVAAADNLAVLPFRLVVLLPILALIVAWRPGVLVALDPATAALALLAVAGGWLVNFFCQVTFGSLAFFLEQSLGIWNVWFGLFALCSGYLFPLAMLPPGLRAVVELLPFRAVVGLSAELLSGRLSGSEALGGLLVQWGWVAFFALLATFTWRRGIRRYEAFGA